VKPEKIIDDKGGSDLIDKQRIIFVGERKGDDNG